MNRRPAVRLLVCLVSLVCLVPLAGAQDTQGRSSASIQIDNDLRLERKLLTLDLSAYREARTVEQRAWELRTQVSARLDQALAGESMSLGTLESLHLEHASAKAATQIAADRVEWQLQRVQDRLRRIGFLEGELGRPAPARDPVSGTWQVSILPQNQTGTFQLEVNGTLVTGSYRLNGGVSGSFRGTYADNLLRLERVDSRRGVDSIFLGSVDPGTGRLGGSWSANDLASGQPASGTWSAIRQGAGSE